MKIFVKIPLDGALKTLTLDVNSDLLIAEIKDKIDNLVNLPPYKKMDLIYAGIRLQDNKALSDYKNIEDESTLYLSLQYRIENFCYVNRDGYKYEFMNYCAVVDNTLYLKKILSDIFKIGIDLLELKVDGKIMKDFDTLYANQVYNEKEVIITVKKNTS